MKRFSCAAVLLGMTLSLFGCGSTPETPDKAGPGAGAVILLVLVLAINSVSAFIAKRIGGKHA